ncbi:zinc finger, C2H2 type [Cooperia oncophora]
MGGRVHSVELRYPRSIIIYDICVEFTVISGMKPHPHLCNRKRKASRATKQYECSMCDYRGPTKQAIRMHTLRYHRQRSCTEDGGSASRNVLMCPQCSTYTSGTKALIEHARAEHGFQGVVATTRFSDWDEFMAWKEKQERRISASWACYSTCSNNGFTTKYYKCKRSFKRKKVLNPKRKRASTPYQSACTSFLKVVVSETTGKIGVEYCDMHFGHLYNATVSPDSDDDSEPGTTQIFMCNVCPTGACHCMDNVESGISGK